MFHTFERLLQLQFESLILHSLTLLIKIVEIFYIDYFKTFDIRLIYYLKCTYEDSILDNIFQNKHWYK